MKRLMTIVLLVMVTLIAEGFEYQTSFGDWGCYTKESMLDGTSHVIILEGEDGAAIMIMGRVVTHVQPNILFPDYLGGNNEDHDKSLVYITDQMAEPMIITRSIYRFISAGITIRDTEISDQMLIDILAGKEMLFRTWDYTNSRVDAVFFSDPANATSAMEWLGEQLNDGDG